MKIEIIGFIKDSLIIGMSLSLLWHFSNIVRYGSHIIQEPNTAILIGEVTLLFSILLFGLWSAVRVFRKYK